MSNAFSEYVALLGDVEHIPETARELPMLSARERARVMARVVDFVRERVLPQSDLEEQGLDALSYSVVAAVGDERTSPRRRDHDAIVERIDELAHGDPQDGAQAQELLYRLHGAIADHFGDAELMLASASDWGWSPPRRQPVTMSSLSAEGARERDYVGPSPWFG